MSLVTDEPKLDAVTVNHDELVRLKQTFDDLGYVILPGALSKAKVDELLQVIEDMRESLENDPSRAKVEGGLNIRPVIQKHPAFMDLLIWPTTFAAVARLLNH